MTDILALDAPPSEGIIPLIKPEIRGNEWRYVKECLDSGWVSSVGPFVDRFEQIVAAKAGTKYGVATVNGTSALHIALLVAGVQPEDEVLVSTLTFIAPVNAIRYVGAWPVFIDAEPDYWQMDPARSLNFLNGIAAGAKERCTTREQDAESRRCYRFTYLVILLIWTPSWRWQRNSI